MSACCAKRHDVGLWHQGWPQGTSHHCWQGCSGEGGLVLWELEDGKHARRCPQKIDEPCQHMLPSFHDCRAKSMGMSPNGQLPPVCRSCTPPTPALWSHGNAASTKRRPAHRAMAMRQHQATPSAAQTHRHDGQSTAKVWHIGQQSAALMERLKHQLQLAIVQVLERLLQVADSTCRHQPWPCWALEGFSGSATHCRKRFS